MNWVLEIPSKTVPWKLQALSYNILQTTVTLFFTLNRIVHLIGDQCDFSWIPFFPRIFLFFNELLGTLEKAAVDHKVLDRLSILDSGYQWKNIITTALSYDSLKSKSWFIFTKISGYIPLKNRQDFEQPKWA